MPAVVLLRDVNINPILTVSYDRLGKVERELRRRQYFSSSLRAFSSKLRQYRLMGSLYVTIVTTFGQELLLWVTSAVFDFIIKFGT